jgi:hypothetical protein
MSSEIPTQEDSDKHETRPNASIVIAGSSSSTRSRTQSSASYDSCSSTGSVTYQPERRRILWEASWLAHEDPQYSSPTETPTTDSSSFSWIGSPTSASSQMSTQYAPRMFDSTCPCQVKWLNLHGLLFTEVRGLRNSWNEDKEIQVARNVTPVEPNIAGALLARMNEPGKTSPPR